MVRSLLLFDLRLWSRSDPPLFPFCYHISSPCISFLLCLHSFMFRSVFLFPTSIHDTEPFPCRVLMLPVLCLQAVRLLLESIHTYRLQQRIETVLEGCKQYSVNHDQIVKPESDHHILKCML